MPGPKTQILTTNKSPMTLSGDTLVITIKKGDGLKGDLLNKLNTTLISIVKHEWRTSWTNFIPDIC